MRRVGGLEVLPDLVKMMGLVVSDALLLQKNSFLISKQCDTNSQIDFTHSVSPSRYDNIARYFPVLSEGKIT